MGFTNQNEHKHTSDYEADMFTGITTYHGLVRIYNSKAWPGRCFWITVVVAAYTLFVYQAANLLRAYHQKPTNYQTSYIVPEGGVDFPSVTICNFSPIMKSRIERSKFKDISKNVTRYLSMSFLTVENLHTFGFTEESLTDLDDQYKGFVRDYNQTQNEEFKIQDFFTNVGFTCEQMFLVCVYNGMRFNCCGSDSGIKPVMTDAGMCFKFRDTGADSYMKKEYVSGEAYGLQLIINVSMGEYPKGQLTTMDYGIKFYPHRDGEMPFMNAKGIALPPGNKGYASVSLSQWSLLDRENWGNCQYGWQKDDKPYLVDTPYSLANCQVNCMADLFYKRCRKADNSSSCAPIRYHLSEKMEVCSPKELYDCMNISSMMVTHSKRFKNLELKHYGNIAEVIENLNTSWYQEVCNGKRCSTECDKIDYQVYMSYTAIHKDLIFEQNPLYKPIIDPYKQRTENESQLKDDVVVLNVFMRDIAYTKFTEQKSLSATVILSNIGGNTGMFLGMSIITLAEIFIFFTKYTWVICSGRRKQYVKRKIEKAREDEEIEKEF